MFSNKKEYEDRLYYFSSDQKFINQYYEKIYDKYIEDNKCICDNCIKIHIHNNKLCDNEYVFESINVHWWELCIICQEKIKLWFTNSNYYVRLSYEGICGEYDSEIEDYDIDLEKNVEYTNDMIKNKIKFDRYLQEDTLHFYFSIVKN
jgi:hypothetical protein